MKKSRKVEILRAVNKALEWQFSNYSWADMIDDGLPAPTFNKEEREWAKNNTGYKAYICE